MPLREVHEREIVAAPVDHEHELPNAPDGVGVLAVIEYRVSDGSLDAFLAAISERQKIRLRDGAREVTLFQDAVDAEVWAERFYVSSWAEHRRQLARRTLRAKQLDDALLQYHSGEYPPQHRYYLKRRLRRDGEGLSSPASLA